MVFRWGQVNIGFNGLQWLSTIGPTMEWLLTVVKVGNSRAFIAKFKFCPKNLIRAMFNRLLKTSVCIGVLLQTEGKNYAFLIQRRQSYKEWGQEDDVIL